MIIEAQHVFFNRLTTVGSSMPEQVADHTIVAIQRRMQAIELGFAIFLHRKLLLSRQEA